MLWMLYCHIVVYVADEKQSDTWVDDWMNTNVNLNETREDAVRGLGCLIVRCSRN